MKKNFSVLKPFLTKEVKILSGIVLLHFFVNIFWHALNNAPITWDPAAHIRISFEIADKIMSGRFFEILYVSNYYPILIHTITALLIVLLKIIQLNALAIIEIAQILDTVIFIGTLWTIYFWVKKVFDVRVALYSVILFSFFPIVYNQSRFFMLDIASIGLLFGALLCLEKSRGLIEKKSAILFFVFSGMLLMTKWTGAIYLFIPAVFLLAKLKLKIFSAEVLPNIIKGVIIGALIVLPWYLTNLKSLEFQGAINIVGEKGADPTNLLSVENFLQYIYIFTFTQLSPIPAFLFFGCLLLSFFVGIKNKAFLLTMIIGNYFIFTFVSNKDARYTIFMLPFVSILITQVAFYLNEKKKYLGSFLFGFILSFLFLYYLVLSIRPVGIEGFRTPITLPLFGLTNPIDVRDYLVQRYDNNDWQMPAIVSDLKELDREKVRVIVASELMYLNSSNIQAYTTALGLKNISISTPDITLLIRRYQSDRFPGSQKLVDYLYENDYLLIPKGDVGPVYIRNYEALKQIQSYITLQEGVKCNQFQQDVAPVQTKCFIPAGETLGSGSDVIVDNTVELTEDVRVVGPAMVFCEWGCSFFIIKQDLENPAVTLQFVKEYPLLDGNTIQLYKINKSL